MKSQLLLSFLAFCSICTAQTLNSVEAVEYDAANNRFLASNGPSVIVVDGNGDEVSFFGSDPESDYGMEVMNGKLFTIVGSHVKAYELSDGTEVMDYTITGAQFLNGMASDGTSRIWVTDFGAKKIHELDVTDIENPSSTIIVNNTVNTPNGITYDGANNRLVFVGWGSSAQIKAIDLSDYAVSLLVPTTLSNIDGIDHDGEGNFYVSSWTPTRITKFSSEFSIDEIITAPGLSSPADICYALEIDTLAIPNSGNNTITFVGFGNTSVFDAKDDLFSVEVFPNPVTDSSMIRFSLLKSENVLIRITNMQGQEVKVWINEKLSSGNHTVLLQELNLASGQYLLECTTESFKNVQPISVR